MGNSERPIHVSYVTRWKRWLWTCIFKTPIPRTPSSAIELLHGCYSVSPWIPHYPLLWRTESWLCRDGTPSHCYYVSYDWKLYDEHFGMWCSDIFHPWCYRPNWSLYQIFWTTQMWFYYHSCFRLYDGIMGLYEKLCSTNMHLPYILKWILR